MKTHLLAASLLLTSILAPAAHACNYRQLTEDMRWCLQDAGANQNAKAKIVGAAATKNAALLDDGFNQCQSHSDTARKNYGQCAPGTRIDTARAILETK